MKFTNQTENNMANKAKRIRDNNIEKARARGKRLRGLLGGNTVDPANN